LAGVSTQTVSRVINNYPNIRPETRTRVVEAMRALDYRVNNAARALGTASTRTIGVIATDAKAWIEFNDKVVSHYRQLGYEYPRVSHETNTLVASEVRAGHSVTALWEVEFHQGAQGRAATVYVSYVDCTIFRHEIESRKKWCETVALEM